MTPTEQLLRDRYGGPFLTLENAAEVLKRRPNALRVLMNSNRGDPVLAARLRTCRVRHGRRVLFKLCDFARLIVDEA